MAIRIITITHGLSGFVAGKQAIIALNAVTTDRVINLLLVDGTKDDLIFKALQKRLVDSQVSFDITELDRYKGIIYSIRSGRE